MTKTNLFVFPKKIFAEITEVPEVFKQTHFPGLDGLRAISIALVLLGHSLIGTPWVEYLPGSIGVDMFFVISGFLITTLLLKEKIKNGTVSLKNFYIRRILRIFPLVYLYLITLFFLDYFFKLKTSLKMFLSAGFYIDNFPIQNGKNWYTSHFWSLAVEEQFYLAYPLLLIKKNNLYIITIFAILVLLPFIVLAGSNWSHFYGNNRIFGKCVLSLTYILGYGTTSILIGSLFSILIFKKIFIVKKRYPHQLSLILLLFVLFIRAMTASGIIPLNNIFIYFISTYFYASVISIIIILNLRNNLLSNALNNAYVIKLGVLSYSIYIWQQIFTYDQPWKNTFKYGGSIFLNGICLLMVAYVSYYFYELKFLKLKEKFHY